ncbi:MAG: quinol:cytochrome C oxidoreductase, partial [Flavobacteriales bacterium]
MEFTFPKKAKTTSFILMAIGLIAVAVGAFTATADRFWSNVLVNGIFFIGLSIGALFFTAVNNAGEAAWGVVFQRVWEAIFSYIPVGAVVLLLVFIVGSFHGHHIYHWMGETNDPILEGKSPYLNLPFWWIRNIIYLAVFIIFARYFRKQSLKEDEIGGSEILNRNYKLSALYLAIFGVSTMTLSWDWVMSITPHWYSTLFGWYVFGGMWCSGTIATVLIVLYLKNLGHL